MIAYVTVGVDDIVRAEQFYSAFLLVLGYELEEIHGDLSYALPVEPGKSPVGPEFYVKSPFDGRPASVGNGSMVAFEARSQQQVRDLHTAALTKVSRVSVTPTDRIFTLATFVTLKVTRSHCSPAIQMNLGGTGNVGFEAVETCVALAKIGRVDSDLT